MSLYDWLAVDSVLGFRTRTSGVRILAILVATLGFYEIEMHFLHLFSAKRYNKSTRRQTAEDFVNIQP